MPYKDKQKHTQYQIQWKKKRRDAWFEENGPCIECGSWENLELDHVDHTTKVSHNIWSWADERRLEELAKCVARCRPCHIEKSKGEAPKGEDKYNSKLTEDDVRYIRESNRTAKQLAEELNVHWGTIKRVKYRQSWKHI